MADEIVLSGLGDLRATHLLNREVFELLHDPTDLRAACVFVPFDMAGSGVLKTGQIDVDYAMAAPGAITAPSNTAFVDSSFSLTPARYALRFELEDLAEITDNGQLNLQKLARIVANTAGLTFTNLLCALFDGLSTVVGGGASAATTVSDMYDAMFALNEDAVPGPYYAVLHPKQINNFLSSLRGEPGAMQFQSATADMLALRGPGFKGSFLGVEYWQSDSVPVGSSARRGAMFGRGCFAYTEAPVSKITPQIDRRVAVADSSVFVTTVWDDAKALWRVVGNYYPAVVEVEDARGVEIASES